MISQGYLVQDWKGRVGITLGTCRAPEIRELDESLKRVVSHCDGPLRWWRIALFSGAIVKSPEPTMELWGPASKSVLEWAIRRAARPVAKELKLIWEAFDLEPEDDCEALSLPDKVA